MRVIPIFKIGISLIGYAHSQKIGIIFIGYAHSQKIGITFIRYASQPTDWKNLNHVIPIF
jgi:hypothetical protein